MENSGRFIVEGMAKILKQKGSLKDVIEKASSFNIPDPIDKRFTHLDFLINSAIKAGEFEWLGQKWVDKFNTIGSTYIPHFRLAISEFTF